MKLFSLSSNKFIQSNCLKKKKTLCHNRVEFLFVQNYRGLEPIGTFQSGLHYFEHRAVHVFEQRDGTF